MTFIRVNNERKIFFVKKSLLRRVYLFTRYIIAHIIYLSRSKAKSGTRSRPRLELMLIKSMQIMEAQ